MSDALGFLSKAAFRKDRGLFGGGPAITYPQAPGATDLAASHQLPFSSEGIGEAIERDQDTALVGSGRPGPGAIISRKVSGPSGGLLRWLGWERLMACGMGFEFPCPTNGSPKQLGATTARFHLFEQDEVLHDQPWHASEIGTYIPPSVNDRKVRRGMFGADKQVNQWVWNSVFVNKITIAGTPTEVKIDFEFIGYQLYRGSYNAPSWTLPTGSTARALFQQGIVKLGPRAGGAGALTTFCPNSWEIVMDNKLTGDDITTCTAPRIEQPMRNEFREVSFKVGFPRYNTAVDSIHSLVDLDTELAASVVLTGPILTGIYNHQWGFYMSSIRPKTPEIGLIGGSSPLTATFEFECHRPGGSNIFAGLFNGITLIKDSELITTVVNSMATNYLLET